MLCPEFISINALSGAEVGLHVMAARELKLTERSAISVLVFLSKCVREDLSMSNKSLESSQDRLKANIDLQKMVAELLNYSSINHEYQELLDVIESYETYPDRHDLTVNGQVEVLKIYVQAVQVFESFERAQEWMHSEIPVLGNCVPVTLMNEQGGRKDVFQVLRKMEFGEYV